MCDSAVHPHAVGPKNSCSSVSDLSEAISDMSLSTSPGSDLPTSASNSNMLDMMSALPNNSGDTRPNPYPRKKRVICQLSSNPYLASSEMSPDDQIHPIVLGANSYAGEPSPEVLVDVCPRDSSYTSSSHRLQYVKANSVPLATDFVTNSNSDDDSDQEVVDGVDSQRCGSDFMNQRNHYNRYPDSGHNNYYLHNNGDNLLAYNYESFNSKRDDRDVSSFQYNSNLQCTVESFDFRYQSHNHTREMVPIYSPDMIDTGPCNYYSHGPTPSPVKHSGNIVTIPTSESCPPSQNHFNNVHLRRDKERHHNSSSSYHDQPRSREINSWGHFSKHTERHYKYRRSHCNSSDSDDESQRYYKNKSFEMPSPSLSEKSHSHCHPPSSHYNRHRSSSASALVSNSTKLCNKNQNEISRDKLVYRPNGVKPPVFKERFQVMKRWFAECNDGQKNVILKGLLKLCELPQLHLLSVHMSRELHHGCPSNCEDILTWLPTHLATKVMAYLDPVSLCRAAQVCSVWRSLAEDQSLWRRFCCQTKWRLSKAAEHKQVISHMSAEGSIQWKNVFAERFRLRNNWLKGRRTVRTFEGHHQGISCVQFDDSRIVSGSSDKTIKVWNMRTNAPWSVQTLMGHHGTVRCLHLEGNRLVSGSCDTTIKVWDLSTEESWSSIACKVTMTGHTDTVRCLQADEDKVISGSYDKTLKIWDLKSGELRQTLRGHQGSVLCVHFSETKIVSGSVDKTIKLWNYEGCCMNTLCGHQDAVTCLMFDSTRIVSGSLDHNLKFWDVHSGECLNTIDWKMAEGHTGVIRCLQADSWRVVSAGDDKTIKVWNLATGERLVTLRDHTDGVTCLQFNDFIIVSGSYDKTVKLWDFSCC